MWAIEILIVPASWVSLGGCNRGNCVCFRGGSDCNFRLVAVICSVFEFSEVYLGFGDQLISKGNHNLCERKLTPGVGLRDVSLQRHVLFATQYLQHFSRNSIVLNRFTLSAC